MRLLPPPRPPPPFSLPAGKSPKPPGLLLFLFLLRVVLVGVVPGWRIGAQGTHRPPRAQIFLEKDLFEGIL